MKRKERVGVVRLKVNVFLRGDKEGMRTICYPPANGMRLKQENNTVGLFIESALKKFGIQFCVMNNFHARLIPNNGRNGGVTKWLNNEKTISGQDVQDNDTIEIVYQGKLVRIGAEPDDPAEFYRIGDPSLDVPGDAITRLKEKARIGSGTFGIVYRAMYKGKEIAIKDMREFRMNDWNKVKILSREIEIMKTIKHPCIMSILGVVQATRVGECPVLLMPLMGPSLKKLIEDNKYWSYTNQYIAIYGTAVGLAALHESGVIHRDIKPDNVLLDDRWYPVICDFGLAKSIDTDAVVTQSMKCGTCGYMAPEIISEEKYGKAVDVYSFGIFVYAVLSKQLNPFPGLTGQRLKMEIVAGKRPDLASTNISSTLQDIIVKCWDGDYHNRPSFETIVKWLEEPGALTGVDMAQFEAYKQYINSASQILIHHDGDSDAAASATSPVKAGDVSEYRAMAAMGNPVGYEKLAECYKTGRGVTKDPVVAAAMLEAAQAMKS